MSDMMKDGVSAGGRHDLSAGEPHAYMSGSSTGIQFDSKAVGLYAFTALCDIPSQKT